jgi:hypothetical protein
VPGSAISARQRRRPKRRTRNGSAATLDDVVNFCNVSRFSLQLTDEQKTNVVASLKAL